jgi:hypothetical protein
MCGKELVQFRLAPVELHPQGGKILFSVAEIAVIAKHPELPCVFLKQKVQIAINFGDNVRLRFLSELLQFRLDLIEIPFRRCELLPRLSEGCVQFCGLLRKPRRELLFGASERFPGSGLRFSATRKTEGDNEDGYGPEGSHRSEVSPFAAILPIQNKDSPCDKRNATHSAALSGFGFQHGGCRQSLYPSEY